MKSMIHFWWQKQIDSKYIKYDSRLCENNRTNEIDSIRIEQCIDSDKTVHGVT